MNSQQKSDAKIAQRGLIQLCVNSFANCVVTLIREFGINESGLISYVENLVSNPVQGN